MKRLEALDVVEVERIEGCGIIVTFSDATSASYSTEELAFLRPHREPTPTEEAN